MTEIDTQHDDVEHAEETQVNVEQQNGVIEEQHVNEDIERNDNIDKTDDTNERQRKESVEKKKFLADLNEHLQQYYDKRVAKSVERKTEYENIAFNIVYKVIRKVQTVDERFRASNLVTLGIPYDGIQAGKAMEMEMILQLPLGENNSVYVIKDKTSYYAKIQPYVRDYWSDCMDPTGTFISAKLVLETLREYLQRTVNVFSKYIKTQQYDKLPEKLKSISLEPGPYNSTLILNENIKVSVLPALYVPDCRIDLTRKDIPSCSHVVAAPKIPHFANEAIANAGEQMNSTQDILDTVNQDPSFSWKYSFYVAEKNKMRTAVEGCRIKILRIITEIRDSDPRLRRLSLDHIKSIFFQECDRIRGRRDWNDSKLAQRLLSMARCFLATFHDGFCPSYFMQPPDFPILNIFHNLNADHINEMSTAFEDLLQNPIALLEIGDNV